MNLSVVIPSFNRAALLALALDSVLSQQLPAQWPLMEVIVVDDGSNDDTKALIHHEYPTVRYHFQENSGVSAARNTGIELAKGQWVALLDSDDEWLPNKLIQQQQRLQDTGLLVCHTQERWLRNGVFVNQMNKHQKVGGWIFERCLPLCVMSPSSIILHRSVFESVGVFDPALPACEDYDLWLRISRTYQVALVEQACLNKYGGHADQLSRKYWGMDRYRVIALQKILNQPLTKPQHTAALAMLIRKLEILLVGARKHNNQQLVDQCLTHLATLGVDC